MCTSILALGCLSRLALVSNDQGLTEGYKKSYLSLSQVERIGQINSFVSDDVLLLHKFSLHPLKLLSCEDGSCALADVSVDRRRRRRCRRRWRRVDIFDAGMPYFRRRRRISVVFGKASEAGLRGCEEHRPVILIILGAIIFCAAVVARWSWVKTQMFSFSK